MTLYQRFKRWWDWKMIPPYIRPEVAHLMAMIDGKDCWEMKQLRKERR